MECPICLTDIAVQYEVGCAAKHVICADCECAMRLRSGVLRVCPEGQTYRPLKCPLCRGDEKVAGKRTDVSYQKELAQVYKAYNVLLLNQSDMHQYRERYEAMERLQVERQEEVLARLRVQQEEHRRLVEAREARRLVEREALRASLARLPKLWCIKRGQGCNTKSKTPRKCHVIECLAPVCRACHVCPAH